MTSAADRGERTKFASEARTSGIRLWLVLSLAALGSLGPGVARAAPTVNECLDASEKGQELRDNGKLTRARELFTTCASAGCPGPVRASCSQWREQVVESMPSILVVVRNEADDDVVEASVAVDGVTHDTRSGRPLALDPGAHTVSVAAPGYERAEQKIIVNIGEKNRLVRVKIVRPAPAPVPPVAASVAPASSDAASSSSPPALPIGLGGVALAAIGTSLVLGLSTRSELSDLRAAPCATTRTCDEAAVDGLRTRFLVADVLLGVGIVAAGAAVYFWLSNNPSKTTTSGPRDPFRLRF